MEGIVLTKEKVFKAFKKWGQAYRKDPEAIFTDEEWEQKTPEEQAEFQSNYFMELLDEVENEISNE